MPLDVLDAFVRALMCMSAFVLHFLSSRERASCGHWTEATSSRQTHLNDQCSTIPVTLYPHLLPLQSVSMTGAEFALLSLT